MNWPPRVIAILSLIQMFFIVGGYFVTCSLMKIFDRTVPEMMGSRAPRPPVTVEFIRHWGLWVLLLPLAWCVIASLRSRWEDGYASVGSIRVAVGSGITLLVACVFSLGTLAAISLVFET